MNVASQDPFDPLPSLTLVLGGARSGKSAYAEGLIATRGAGVYLATAEAGDAEMADRIRRHKARRGDAWSTVEAPLDPVAALEKLRPLNGPVLLDCLTLWLSNVMAADRDPESEGDRLLAGLKGLGVPVVAVSNEVGLGIVPDNDLARAFRDAAGRLNQRTAAVADRVVFVAAGLPMVLKDPLPVEPNR